jgi:hypothetical protein
MENKNKKSQKLIIETTQWSIDRFEVLIREDRHEDAIALNEEFNEWINYSIEGGFDDPNGQLEVVMIS